MDQNQNSRVYEVDLLRFVAAVMVMIFHYTFRGYAADNMTIMPYPYIAPVAQYGYLGVNLFFIISGFVILWTALNSNCRLFFISRFVRLYPAFWACCTATFLVTKVMGGQRFSASVQQYLINMTMLGGFIGVPSIDGAYWSLFVEMKFYLLVFLFLLFGLIKNIEIFLGLWTIIIASSSIIHIPYISFFLIPEYAAYFIAGSICYIIYDKGLNPYRGFILASSFFIALMKALSYASELEQNFSIPFNPIVISLILFTFFVLFLLIATKRSSFLSTPRWLILGALTYPLYLIHQYVGYMVFNVMYPVFNVHFIMWGTVFCMLLFAYGINRFIEKKYAHRLKLSLKYILKVEPRV